MNIADFVYSESTSPLTIGRTKSSVSPSSGFSEQKLANAQQVQDLRAAAFNELQQSIQSYNDSFVKSMRYQEKQERLYKQQQLEQLSTSWAPAIHGNGYNDGYMDGGNYGNRCFGRGDNSGSQSASGTRLKGEQRDWNGNNLGAYHHPCDEYDNYDNDNTMDDRSTIGSPRVPSKDSRMMNELVAILQTGTINDYAPVMEWESEQNVLGLKQMPCGDLWM